MKKPLWIWYPGDFEKWLQEQVFMRRDFRQIVQPQFWRMDSCAHKVRFSRPYHADRPCQIKIYSDARVTVGIEPVTNLIEENTDGTYTLPACDGQLFIDAYIDGLPAVLVEGGDLASGRDWVVSLTKDGGLPAGCYDSFDDPQMPPTAFALQQTPMPYAEVTEAEATFRGKQLRGRLFDFGKETFGYLTFRGVKGDGTLYAFYGESKEEALSPDFCETFDIRQARDTAELPVNHSRAFRYVFAAAEDAAFEDLSFAYEFLPVEYRGRFLSSDEKLNQIWDTALYTLHLNTREFFLDGIKRDRWVWGGDAYQSGLMNYYSFFDRDICKRTLYALCPKLPIEQHIDHIPDYTFYWFSMLYDYYYFTGDLAFVQEIYDRAEDLLNFCIQRSEDNLFLYGQGDDFVFVDWADMEKEGALSVEQILYVQALKVMSQMAGLVGRPEAQERYAAMSRQLMQETERVFWEEEKGAFIHSIGDYGRCETVTRYANMFALMYDLVDNEKKEKIAKNVIKNPAVQEVGTPYARFYELDAIGAVGDKDYILQEIRSYWGGMLDLGATSFWEKFSCGETDHYEMYGRPFGRSLCHAWGASPVYLLGKYFLGITPASAGYTSFLAVPYLGDLAFVEGSVPTANGDIHLRMDRSAVTITAEKIPGRLLLHSETPPLTETAAVMHLDGTLYALEISAGVTHKILYMPV